MTGQHPTEEHHLKLIFRWVFLTCYFILDPYVCWIELYICLIIRSGHGSFDLGSKTSCYIMTAFNTMGPIHSACREVVGAAQALTRSRKLCVILVPFQHKENGDRWKVSTKPQKWMKVKIVQFLKRSPWFKLQTCNLAWLEIPGEFSNFLSSLWKPCTSFKGSHGFLTCGVTNLVLASW